MKTFTNCAEKKAKQFLNLLQGYTKGIRMTAILVLLLMGVSNTWGADWHLQNNPSHIYFCDATTKWAPNSSDHIIFLMGRDYTYGNEGVGSQAYDMIRLSNTKLWYYNVPTWGDGDNGRYQYIAFRHATSAWTDWKGETVTYRATWNNSKYSMTRNDNISGKTLYYEPQSSTTNTNTNVTGYLPKYTATVDFKVSRDGGSSYNVTNKKFGTITLKGTYMDGDAATGQSSPTITGENKYNYDNIPVTGEFTLTNTALTNDTYEFVGFGTGNTPTDKVNTKTWNITENTAYYVFYKHKLYTVTYSKGTYGSGSNQTANKLHGETLALADKGAFTRTGYTQTAWNTNTDGKSGTSYALKANYTSNQAITLYPTWTANRSTITWNANGGSVTPASSTYTYDGAAVTLPTPTRTGYSFNGWFTASTGGTRISDVGKTNKPASNTTYYAQWTENTYTVNIVANPAEAAKTLTLGSQQVGINPVNISTSPNIGYQFKNWTATAGITITNPNSANTTIKATKAGTVTANFEEKFTTIYLEPTGYWNSHTPQYVAHVWGSGEDNIIMTGVGDAPYKYYKAEVPYGYTNVVFFRNSTDGKTLWNQTGDLTIPTDNKTLYEIKSTGDGTTTKATGEWKAANLVYTITLNFCDFGTYGIKYNGQSFFSKPNDNVTIDLPAGAEIEVLAGQPYNEAYTGDVYISSPTVKDVAAGEKITITGNITFEDNFVTKESHVVYLGVPNTLAAWNVKENNIWYYIWRFTTKGDIKMVEELDRGKLAFEANGIKYYEFTISAGCNKIMFQHKQSAPTTTRESSVSLLYGIPLTEVNCFTLDGNENGNGYFTGSWNVLPAQVGDHRLLYIEQKVVKLENGHPETTVTKAHPSDIIRQGDTRDTYSLHIYNEVVDGENGMNDPEILVQECTGYDGVNPIWTTRERHMVFGPLHADFGMAAMPGRRDAAGDPDAVLRNDNGIENIKKDINTTDPRFADDQASGVWNFVVTRDNSKNFTGLDLTQTARYEGTYYVRTDCATGGWNNYTATDNHMTYSEVSKGHSNYSHYFCKWVGEAGVNVKYTIANNYGYAISDTLTADKTTLWGEALTNEQKMVTNETLPAEANVRFSWNEKSNFLHRAYLAGSTDVSDRFLIVNGEGDHIFNAEGGQLTKGQADTDRFGLNDNEEIFSDISNWVYYADVQLVPNANLKVTADYSGKVQYFVGQENNYNNTILKGQTGSTEKYLIRLLYDFKTNHLLSAYVPGASTMVDAISTNLMLIRQNNNEAKQLVFNINSSDMTDIPDDRKAYGVIEFTEDYLLDSDKPYLQRCLYWISFPFDVNLTEAFGSLVYGKHWLIQEYDGAARAQYGLWEETGTYWKLHWDPTNIVLKAGFGYVLEIDIDLMIKEKIIDTEDEKKQIAELYFPSKDPITRTIINQDTYNVKMPDHKCNVVGAGRYGDRRIYDSHWNVMGVPSYVNTGATFSDPTYALNDVVKYYYRWDGAFDQYTPMDASEQPNPFLSMYAYMVQYAGDITWNSVLLDEKPAQIAAKKNPETSEHAMRLELQQGNGILDKTFVRLQDDVVTPAFDFNYDLCKITNKGANIYSIITAETSPVEVAANVLPIEETIIPLGVKTDKAGEYTFAMPEGTDGIVVELIDYETNTRTNMLLSDYTVTLPKGTNDTRFALHVKPSKVVTGVENIGNSENGLNGETMKKYLIDGVLYLQKGNLLYDAQGRCVQ